MAIDLEQKRNEHEWKPFVLQSLREGIADIQSGYDLHDVVVGVGQNMLEMAEILDPEPVDDIDRIAGVITAVANELDDLNDQNLATAVDALRTAGTFLESYKNLCLIGCENMRLHTIEFAADRYDIPAKVVYEAIRNGELTVYLDDWGTDPVHAVDCQEFREWAKEKRLIK